MESPPGPGFDGSSPEPGQPDRAVGELEHGAIEVAGIRRTYWLARAPRRAGQRAAAPLLLVLHGSFMDGALMREWTGYEFDVLADREPRREAVPADDRGTRRLA